MPRRSTTLTEPVAERIDAHHHVWDLAVRPQPWTNGLTVLERSYAFDEVVPALDRHRIDRTVLVQTVAVADETPDMLALVLGQPRIAGVVGWVDLTRADVADQLARLQQAPGGDRLVGIRHLASDEPDPRWLCRPDVRRGLAAVGVAGLVYDLLVWRHQLPAVVETVHALPDQRFVLDHAGKPSVRTGELQPWADEVHAIARAENVAVKLSGLIVEADPHNWTVDDLRPYADTVLGSFGPGRVMYGSDWPVCLLASSYDDVAGSAEVLTAQLTADERRAVWGGTARGWYGLARAGGPAEREEPTR